MSNISEIKIKVDTPEIKRRFHEVFDILDKGSIEPPVIIPVIKNNANGLGFEQMYKLYSELLNDVYDNQLGECLIAASYAEEFYIHAKDDSRVRKLAWIWSVDNKWKEVKNLELCCKTRSQLVFCLENGIPFHIVFNIGMNRGGFLHNKEDFEYLNSVLSEYGYEHKRINITTHCPYSEERDILGYQEKAEDLISDLIMNGFHLGFVHIANSVVTRKGDLKKLYSGVRLGELLLLPQPVHTKRKLGDRFGEYYPVEYSVNVHSVMDIHPGETVGYCAYQAVNDMRVATLPVGYYTFPKINYVVHEKTGNKMQVLAQMHDISVINIDGVEVEEGDKIILFGGDDLQTSFLENENWAGCVQKTYQFNKDLTSFSDE